jgi:hypothetical protein
METSGGPIAPNTEVRAVEAVLTLDCATLLARTVSAPSTLTMTLAAPASVVVTGSTSGTFLAADCPSATDTATLRMPFTVAVTRDAPGLVDLPVRAEAVLDSHPTDAAIGGTPHAAANFTVVAGAALLSEVRLATKFKECGCPVLFDLDVTNFGNVRTLYTFQLASTPEGLPAGAIVLPEPFELPPSTPGSTSTGTAKLVFVGPEDSVSGEVALSVSVLSSAVDDPKATGTPLTVTMLVRNPNPVDKAAPGLDGFFVVLLLASLAAAVARRRA